VKNLGLLMIAAGIGYTIYRFDLAYKNGVASDVEGKIFATSGALPVALLVGVGGYLYLR
jgi:hypothetical protein